MERVLQRKLFAILCSVIVQLAKLTKKSLHQSTIDYNEHYPNYYLQNKRKISKLDKGEGEKWIKLVTL